MESRGSVAAKVFDRYRRGDPWPSSCKCLGDLRGRVENGMGWPGDIKDGKAALKEYRETIRTEAKEMGLALSLRSEPIYSIEEAGGWVSEAKAEKTDGLVLVLLDRQGDSWPTVFMAADSNIPT
ncbi:MAG: hypothetical protein ACYS29_10285, partial [Planctomycetota bacterium]